MDDVGQAIGGKIMFGLMGAAVLFAAYWMLKDRRERISREKIEGGVPVTARIVHVEKGRITVKRRKKHGGTRYGSVRAWTPTYEYEYGGRSYRVKAYNPSKSKTYREGDTASIFIDPNGPRALYDPKYERRRLNDRVLGAFLLGFVGVLLLIGAVFA